MDIRRYFGVPVAKASSTSAAGSSKDGKSSKKSRSKDGSKRKVSKTSDSDEGHSKESKTKAHKKKKRIIESDSSDEEPLPSKIRKKSQDSGEKTEKQKRSRVVSDEEEVLPSRLQNNSKNGERQKEQAKAAKVPEKSPLKMVRNVSEYFGSKPVERSARKSQKRKERGEESSELQNADNNVEHGADEKPQDNHSSPEHPAKKAKKSLLGFAWKPENSSQELRKKQDKTSASPSKSSSKQKDSSLTPSKTQSLSGDMIIEQSSIKSELVGKHDDKAKTSSSKPVDNDTRPSSSDKTVTPKKQKSETKTTPRKQTTSDTKTTPEKQTSDTKTTPRKQTTSDTKTTPRKQTTSDTKTTPTKQTTSDTKTTPRKQTTSDTKTTPSKQTTSDTKTTPTKQTTSDTKTTPTKQTTSDTKTTPTKQTTSDTKTPLNNKTITPEKSAATTAKSKTPSVDRKKPSSNATPETSKAQVKSTPVKTESNDGDVVPSSLERKSSAYRSFMTREGPQSLGSKEIPRGSDTCLAGKVFVITGVLESIEREDAVDLVKRHGGKVTQAVSKKTSYLVVGRDPGMSKLDKAKQVGTKQIDEDGLFEMIRSSQPSKSEEKIEQKEVSSQDLESSQFTERGDSQSSMDQSPSQPYHSQSSVFSSASSTPATQTPTASPLSAGLTSESLLWVEKYKPKTLKDIIGQKGDKSNVNKLLRWLRNWYENQKSGKTKAYFAAKEDGSIFKAALLSGPPGVGKTTSANLVCKEAGFSFVEFNASDSRSKKTLEQQISELLNNTTVDGYLTSTEPKVSSSKHVLIMDEVDGMAGNEDRGGMQELINLIKSTKIPIICMCNDRNSQKVRSLANYCFDLRFQRPRVDQIKGAMMNIVSKEKLQILPQTMEKIIAGANQDVRQVLNNLSMWTSKQKSISYDEAKTDANRAQKDIKLGPFDVTRKIFSAEESSKMTIQDQFSLFFNDYSLIPLFSQENYVQVMPRSANGDVKKVLKCVSDAADSYCCSDLIEKCIRGHGSWNLLPMQAFFSCVLPGTVMRGRMNQRIDFPCWLGKNSTITKNSRILQELVSHAQLSISGSKNELNLDYIPHLRKALSQPLIEATTEDCSSKVSKVIEFMDSYNFVKEDWESIMEVGQFDGNRKPQGDIDSKVKAAFTRIYNKGSHLTPFASNVGAKKKPKKSAADVDMEGLGTSEAPEVSDNDSDEDIAEKFKVKKGGKTAGKKSGKASTSSDNKQGRGKGRGKSKK